MRYILQQIRESIHEDHPGSVTTSVFKEAISLYSPVTHLVIPHVPVQQGQINWEM